MKVALVNPAWSFDGSVYFGCRAAHLPLELGYAQALLAQAGHEPRLFDAELDADADGGTFEDRTRALAARVLAFAPGMTVVTTAPSYLFWRCAPPELRVPMATMHALREGAGALVAVGPHGSTTPRTTVTKLGANAAVLGECEEVLVRLASTPEETWASVTSVALASRDGDVRVNGRPAAADLTALPPLAWKSTRVARHAHHHHRFDREPLGPGAELEATRGCPYHCAFCAKDNYRDAFRRRPLATIMAELDALVAQGVRYVYFIDEIFVPDRALLEALAARDVVFGVQMRIDNWSPPMLDLLGEAGCVSVEAGIESVSSRGRSLLAKKCRLSTAELVARLVHLKRSVPFVQANLIGVGDDEREIAAFRGELAERGVWSNEPVPLFPYPGSPEYTRRWGAPDDRAWERAHEAYLAAFDAFSDIQDPRPLPLAELERRAVAVA